MDLNLPLKRRPFPICGIDGRIPDARMTTVEHLELLAGDLPNVAFMVAGNEFGDTAMGKADTPLQGRGILRQRLGDAAQAAAAAAADAAASAASR